MIGYLSLPSETDPQAHLARLAATLTAAGHRVAGAVQIDSTPDRHDCDMDLRVLDGPTFRISQSLGPHATACRLDAGALAAAVRAVEDRLPGADVLILPKFGRQEAIGRGFRSVIAQAVAQDVPVLLHVPPEQREDFARFCDGMGQHVAPGALAEWCLDQVTGVQ